MSEQTANMPQCELKIQCFTSFWMYFITGLMNVCADRVLYLCQIKNKCGFVLLISDELLWERCKSTLKLCVEIFRFPETHLSVRHVWFPQTSLSTNCTLNNMSTLNWLNNTNKTVSSTHEYICRYFEMKFPLRCWWAM